MIIPSFKHLHYKELKVYLTFDDGPHTPTTQWLTELLITHNCAATFFLLGQNVTQHQELMQCYNNPLFETANHGYAHLNGWKINTTTYLNNYTQGNTSLAKAPNYVTNLFRAPYGKVLPAQYLKLKRHTHLVWWTVMAYDFMENKKAEVLLERLKRKTKAGSIIVLHENDKAYQHIKAILPSYLAWLAQQGYSTGKISELVC